jgi:hypothetical protein
MPLAATIGAVFLLALLFGWAVPLARLFDAFQPLIVALSIMGAAILVRLNRGMPTLDWKSLDSGQRGRLTAKIVELTLEYVVILAANAILLIGLVSLTVIGKADIAARWLPITERLVSAGIGGLIALCLARMTYVVWRDYDVVRLQKAVIDAASLKEDQELQTKASVEKVTAMRGAGLRKQGSVEVRSWDE